MLTIKENLSRQIALPVCFFPLSSGGRCTWSRFWLWSWPCFRLRSTRCTTLRSGRCCARPFSAPWRRTVSSPPATGFGSMEASTLRLCRSVWTLLISSRLQYDTITITITQIHVPLIYETLYLCRRFSHESWSCIWSLPPLSCSTSVKSLSATSQVTIQVNLFTHLIRFVFFSSFEKKLQLHSVGRRP